MKTKDLIEEIKRVGGNITEEQLRGLAKDFDNIPEYFRGKILEYLATPPKKREAEQMFKLTVPKYFDATGRYLNIDLEDKTYFFADYENGERFKTEFTHEEIMFKMPKEIIIAIQHGVLKMVKVD
jgi:hypothetical protein